MKKTDKRIALVIGCRPDCIKMLPLYFELKYRGQNPVLISTGQHRELLSSVLDEFGVVPDYSLDVMSDNQTLASISEKVLARNSVLLSEINPSIVVVHGDTTGSFAAALAAFYLKIPVAHVEAGLRTYDLNSPFPEEFNRVSIDLISDYLFAPTQDAKENLLKEGKNPGRVFVCGNTAIDMLLSNLEKDSLGTCVDSEQNLNVLITLHRRESIGGDFDSILDAIKEIFDKNKYLRAVFPVHPNPLVRNPVIRKLGKCENIRITEPMKYKEFINLEACSALILTDSGGVQEEAATFGVPAVILRDKSERTVDCGGLSYVCGKNKKDITETVEALLVCAKPQNGPHEIYDWYGDGKASCRIADVLINNECKEWGGSIYSEGVQ